MKNPAGLSWGKKQESLSFDNKKIKNLVLITLKIQKRFVS